MQKIAEVCKMGITIKMLAALMAKIGGLPHMSVLATYACDHSQEGIINPNEVMSHASISSKVFLHCQVIIRHKQRMTLRPAAPRGL